LQKRDGGIPGGGTQAGWGAGGSGERRGGFPDPQTVIAGGRGRMMGGDSRNYRSREKLVGL